MSVSLELLPTLLKVTHETLAKRMLVFLVVVMIFALFCWAMLMGTLMHLGIAASFALLVGWPVLLRKESDDGGQTSG